MIIRLTIEDDNGEVFWEDERDACHPFDFKLPPDRPVRGKKHLFYGYIFQPIVKAVYQEQGETKTPFPPETFASTVDK